MTVSLMPSRPPYVRFEQRTEENRDESIKTGGLITRDVNFAIIMQVGSKDSVEMKADEFVTLYHQHARNGLIPAEWADHFEREYGKWKAGQDVSDLGCSVRAWPGVSKAQVENLIAAGVRTVEDAAAMNETTMRRLGMGAREIKQRASAYLEAREQHKAGETIAALRADVEGKEARIESLERRVAELAAMVEATTPRKQRA